MKRRHYATPAAFKQALEQRLKSSSENGTEFARRRQLLVFNRFLARVAKVVGDAVILKGGLVLELRLARARTTRDVDLRMSGSSESVLDRLREAGALDLSDFMRFEVRPDPGHPNIRTEAMQYDGFRFRTECELAGAIYGRPFGVDVAFGDPLVGEPELVAGEDLLAFAGVSPPRVRLYPVPSHIAEKLHAFTMPRARPNSRVRDLPDLALLAQTGPIEGTELRLALQRTFDFRRTHSVPSVVPAAPDFWEGPYAKLAEADQLEWATLAGLVEAVAAFLDPVLRSGRIGSWNPAIWRWE